MKNFLFGKLLGEQKKENIDGKTSKKSEEVSEEKMIEVWKDFSEKVKDKGLNKFWEDMYYYAQKKGKMGKSAFGPFGKLY